MNRPVEGVGGCVETRDLVALLAAFVAAAFAAAKLIADKETKISDFRKDWIASFRQALATCLAEAHVISGRIRIRARHQLQASQLPLDPDSKKSLEDELTEHWAQFRQAFYMVMLHLNFAETSLPLYTGRTKSHASSPQQVWDELISAGRMRAVQLRLAADTPQSVDPISRASPAAIELVRELEDLLSELVGNYDKIGDEAIYNGIDRRILNATLLGNLVIKPEWNRIKRGERQYRKAVWVSSLIALLGVASIVMLLASGKLVKSPRPSDPSTIQINLR